MSTLAAYFGVSTLTILLLLASSCATENTTVPPSFTVSETASTISGVVTAEEVASWTDSGTEYSLLDVRETNEQNGTIISGSLLIPLSQLAGRFGEIPQGIPVVVFSECT